MKNKIGWCSMTFNPAWGCRNECPYCYARALAKRFWKQRYMEECNYHFKLHPNWVWTGDHLSGLKNFKPTFLESQYAKKFPKKPQRIFVGSMSEIEFWREDWVKKVIEKIKQYPQHTFMFLSQFSGAYNRYNFPANCWLGVTVTRNKPIGDMKYLTSKTVRFLSIEPLLEKINIENIDNFEPDWIIVGAESGNRKGKVIPEREWIEVIIDFCNRCDRPIYIKDNLIKYYPEYKELKEFPGVK